MFQNTVKKKSKVNDIKFRAVLFDLDGTLLDTLADLANSTNAALARFDFPTHPTDSYRYFVGDGADCLVRRVLPKGHIDDRIVNEFLIAMQDEYSKHWADNTKPYKGIGELLSALDGLGMSKAVLSNKPDVFTKVMVKKLLPNWSFNIVCGAGPSIPKKPDPTAALNIAEELRVPPRQVLYLGDTNTDMQTASSAGMYAVGSLWGFRSAEELRKNGAKALVEHPMDVLSLLEV